MHDAIVIGKGPAGIQAAIYLGRAGFKTLLVYKDEGALVKADEIDNYYGFENGISAKELLDRGTNQAKRFDVEFVQDEVIMLQNMGDNTVTIEGLKKEYQAKFAIIASGLTRRSLNVPGLKNFEGSGISYCVTCDGFFFRNKKVGLVGYTQYAERELNDIFMFTQDVYLLTNGKPIEFDITPFEGLKVIDKPIASIYGETILGGVEFKDGEKEDFAGLFIAYGAADTTAFCVKSGISVVNNHIEIDDKKMTNMDRIYAAGDCTGAYAQISVAVAEGTLAAREVISRLRAERRK